jgi:hypothetical protein
MSYFMKHEHEGIDIKNLFSDAMEAHAINQAGHLPEEGAWGDQTDFFGSCTSKVQSALNKYEKELLDNPRKGRK